MNPSLSTDQRSADGGADETAGAVAVMNQVTGIDSGASEIIEGIVPPHGDAWGAHGTYTV